MICHEEYCAYARDYGLKLAARSSLPALLTAATAPRPRPDLRRREASRGVPVRGSPRPAVARSTSWSATTTTSSIPTIGLAGAAQPGSPADAVLIVDEAHNLVDRAREYYSPAARRAGCSSEARSLPREPPPDASSATSTRSSPTSSPSWSAERGREAPSERDATGVDHGRARLPRRSAPPPRPRRPDRAATSLFKRDVELWLADDPVVERLPRLARLTESPEQVARAGPPRRAVRRRRRGRSRSVLPRRVALRRRGPRGRGRLRRDVGDARAVRVLPRPARLRPRAHRHALALPSPFPPENRLVVVIDEVDTTLRSAPATTAASPSWSRELAPPDRNVLTLFPLRASSARSRDRIHAPGHRVEIQRGERLRRGAPRHPRPALRGNREPALLLAVLGGVFAEGVDYPGEMLSEVIVVSPALPQVGPERELLKAYFHESLRARLRVRLPGARHDPRRAGRRPADPLGQRPRRHRAHLQALPARPATPRLLPSEWTDGDPSSLLSEDPVAEVRRFFDRF